MNPRRSWRNGSLAIFGAMAEGFAGQRQPSANKALRPSARALSLSAAALAMLIGVTQASNPGVVHYPDLQTWKPDDLRIEKMGGQKLLRFSNTVANRGQGPLEIVPVRQPDGTTAGHQQHYTHDSAGRWFVAASAYVGTFVFHPEHDHWHFEDFALYELRTTASNGGIGDQVLRSSKVTFCMLDNTRDNPALEHAQPQTYQTCGRDTPQGISVGWADTYPWWLPGQHLDISQLASGVYWLVSTVDPNNRLNEGGGAAELNNAAAVKIQIRGNKVTVLR